MERNITMGSLLGALSFGMILRVFLGGALSSRSASRSEVCSWCLLLFVCLYFKETKPSMSGTSTEGRSWLCLFRRRYVLFFLPDVPIASLLLPTLPSWCFSLGGEVEGAQVAAESGLNRQQAD